MTAFEYLDFCIENLSWDSFILLKQMSVFITNHIQIESTYEYIKRAQNRFVNIIWYGLSCFSKKYFCTKNLLYSKKIIRKNMEKGNMRNGLMSLGSHFNEV